jgi:DNA-binding NtrC family response regulator
MSLSFHSAFSRVAVGGDSRDIQALKSHIVTAAHCDLPVLIIGEAATGKEAIARAIHRQSARSSEPFISINCDAISERLLKLELFGYRRRTPAGANRTKRGLFEIANKGTIFLNHVEELSATSQAKLLRVLKQKTVQPYGSRVQKALDTRLISAADHSLVRKMMAGQFRQVLFYQLAVLMIRTPASRERLDRSTHLAPFIADSYREDDSLDGYLDRTLLGAYDHFRALTGSHSETARLFHIERVALYQRIGRARRRLNGGIASEEAH